MSKCLIRLIFKGNEFLLREPSLKPLLPEGAQFRRYQP